MRASMRMSQRRPVGPLDGRAPAPLAPPPPTATLSLTAGQTLPAPRSSPDAPPPSPQRLSHSAGEPAGQPSQPADPKG